MSGGALFGAHTMGIQMPFTTNNRSISSEIASVDHFNNPQVENRENYYISVTDVKGKFVNNTTTGRLFVLTGNSKKQEKLEKKIDKLIQSFPIDEDTNILSNLQMYLNYQIGRCTYERKPKASKKYAEQGVELARKRNNPLYEALNKEILADIKKIKDIDKAAVDYHAIIAIYEELEDQVDLLRIFEKYGLMMLPAVAIFIGGLALNKRWWLKVLLVALIILQPLLMIATGDIVTLEDATFRQEKDKSLSAATDWLAKNYDGGRLLTDIYAHAALLIYTKVKTGEVIHQGSRDYWTESLEHPSKHAQWIWMTEGDRLWAKIHRLKEFKEQFVQVFKRGTTAIYQRTQNHKR